VNRRYPSDTDGRLLFRFSALCFIISEMTNWRTGRPSFLARAS
jgi:hypothetical protein